MNTFESRRIFRSLRPLLASHALLALVALGGSMVGCGHSWDDFDPRLSSSSSGDPSGGMGGGTSVSSSSGQGGMAVSSSSGMAGMGGAGGAGGAGGMGGMGGTGGGKCGGTSALVSEFSGNDAITGAWSANSWGGANITELNGELVVSVPTGTMGGFGAVVNSDYHYDIREDSVWIDVTRVMNSNVSAWTYFNIGLDGDNYIEIYHEGSDLIFGQEIDGNHTKFKTIPYDATAHRFWKIRESGGKAYFETAPDGQIWTEQLQISTNLLFPMDLVRVEIGAGSDGVQMDPGEAHFDNFNGGGQPTQKLCPMHSITDNFDDGVRDRQWGEAWEDSPGMLAEENGRFALHCVDNSTNYAGLQSSRGFDLSESSLTIEIPMTPLGSATTTFGLDFDGPEDRDLEMFFEQGQIHVGYEVDDNFQSLGSLAYSPQMHRWWRVRGSANTVYWETAPDGKTWTTQFQVSPPPVPINALSVEIYGGTWQPVMMPGEGQADNLNLPPP